MAASDAVRSASRSWFAAKADGALERRRQQSRDQADGVGVEIVEGARPVGPDGDDRLHPVLARS